MTNSEVSAVCPGDIVDQGSQGSIPWWQEQDGIHSRSLLASSIERATSHLSLRTLLNSNAELSRVPQVDDEVLCRATRVSPKSSSVDILACNDISLSGRFNAVIRQQDAVPSEPDKADLSACFRPGDVIRAEVVSVGDARAFYCSTAKPHLGVIFARHTQTHQRMYATDVSSMACCSSGLIEHRKVAASKQQQSHRS